MMNKSKMIALAFVFSLLMKGLVAAEETQEVTLPTKRIPVTGEFRQKTGELKVPTEGVIAAGKTGHTSARTTTPLTEEVVSPNGTLPQTTKPHKLTVTASTKESLRHIEPTVTASTKGSVYHTEPPAPTTMIATTVIHQPTPTPDVLAQATDGVTVLPPTTQAPVTVKSTTVVTEVPQIQPLGKGVPHEGGFADELGGNSSTAGFTTLPTAVPMTLPTVAPTTPSPAVYTTPPTVSPTTLPGIATKGASVIPPKSSSGWGIFLLIVSIVSVALLLCVGLCCLLLWFCKRVEWSCRRWKINKQKRRDENSDDDGEEPAQTSTKKPMCIELVVVKKKVSVVANPRGEAVKTVDVTAEREIEVPVEHV